MRDSQYFSTLKRVQSSRSHLYGDLESKNPLIRDFPDYRGYFYTSMLTEDMASGLFPLSHRAKSISIEPKHIEFESILTYALSRSGYRNYDFASALRGFIEAVIRALGLFGKCLYEIVDLNDPETGEIEAFDLSFIHPATVSYENGEWVQNVFDSTLNGRENMNQIRLSSERLLVFNMPERIRANWMKMMESLALLNTLTPEFAIPTLESRDNRVEFNHTAHGRLRDHAVMKLTREIGWNSRKHPPDNILEYYWYHRFLLFEKFKIELRDSVVDSLNRDLETVRKELGGGGRIIVDGLPTREDVEEAREALKTGQRGGEELLNQFRLM